MMRAMFVLFAFVAASGCESSTMLPTSSMDPDRAADGAANNGNNDGGATSLDLREPADMTGAPFSTAAHPALPQVPSQGGAVLSPMSVVTIVAPTDPLASQLKQFGDAIPNSSWWSSFQTEYALGAVTHTQVTGPSLTSYLNTCTSACTTNCSSCLTSTKMMQYIEAATSGQSFDPGHTVYLLMLPSTVTGIFDATLGFNPSEANYDCNIFTGYHSYWNHSVSGQNVTDGWGFIQNCYGFDDVTTITSHEIFEAATDTNLAYALPGASATKPWTDPIWSSYEGGSNVELADLCEGTQYAEAGFVFQRVWSNLAAKAGGDPCVPALTTPFNNVSVPQGWYAVAPGATVNVPVTGWSTAAMSDWIVGMPGSLYGNFTGKVTTSTHKTVAGTSYATINNGGTATLSITAPTSAASGEWITMSLTSYPLDWAGPSGTTPSGEDLYHYWPIGFYVP